MVASVEVTETARAKNKFISQRSQAYKRTVVAVTSIPAPVRPDISLIVVNYHTPEKVEQLLESLWKHPPSVSWEAIIVDICPHPDSGISWRREMNVHLELLSENRGFAASVNAAIHRCTGRYIMPMNADLFFKDDAIATLVHHLDNNPEVGITAPWLLNTDGTPQYNARRFYSWAVIACRRSPLGRFLPSLTDDHLMVGSEQKTQPFAADWTTGAALVVRRDLINNNQLYDEQFFLYFEDVDLCARAHLEGWIVDCHPQAQLVHQHARRSRKLWTREGRAHFVSLFRFWMKYKSLKPEPKTRIRQLSALPQTVCPPSSSHRGVHIKY